MTRGVKAPIGVDAHKRVNQGLAIAIRHTDARGEVVARVANRGGRVELTIEDTGQGIAPEHLPTVLPGDTSRTVAPADRAFVWR